MKTFLTACGIAMGGALVGMGVAIVFLYMVADKL